MAETQAVTEDAARDPFLPPLVPTDNPPSKQTNRKTLLGRTVLVVVFFAIYQVLGGGGHHPAHVAQVREVCETHWLSSWGPVVVLVGLFFAWLWHVRRGSKYWQAGQEAGALAILDGDLVRAREEYLALARHRGSHAALWRCNAADMALRLGDFDCARDELLAVDRMAGIMFGDAVRVWSAIQLGRLFALRGELERADAWIRSSRERLARHRDERTYYGRGLRVAEVILLARREKEAEALALLESEWRRIAHAHELGASLLLRAYLISRTSGPRNAGASAPWVAALRLVDGVGISYLWSAWPELEAFALDAGLATRLDTSAMS